MLKKVKTALRVSHDKLDDDEIKPLILASRRDLMLAGIIRRKALAYDDPLITRAIILYCKSHFGIDNKDSEKYQKAYDMLKMHLSLSGDYVV